MKVTGLPYTHVPKYISLRPYVAEPLTNGLSEVEVTASCLYFKHKPKRVKCAVQGVDIN